MIKKEVVGNVVKEVKSNGTFNTGKPSHITMAVSPRFALDASKYYLDTKEGIDIETGLIGFELVALYEDGKPEVKEVVDLKFEKIGETLEDVVDKAKDFDLYSEEKKDDNTTPFEDYEKSETEKEGE